MSGGEGTGRGGQIGCPFTSLSPSTSHCQLHPVLTLRLSVSTTVRFASSYCIYTSIPSFPYCTAPSASTSLVVRSLVLPILYRPVLGLVQRLLLALSQLGEHQQLQCLWRHPRQLLQHSAVGLPDVLEGKRIDVVDRITVLHAHTQHTGHNNGESAGRGRVDEYTAVYAGGTRLYHLT